MILAKIASSRISSRAHNGSSSLWTKELFEFLILSLCILLVVSVDYKPASTSTPRALKYGMSTKNPKDGVTTTSSPSNVSGSDGTISQVTTSKIPTKDAVSKIHSGRHDYTSQIAEKNGKIEPVRKKHWWLPRGSPKPLPRKFERIDFEERDISLFLESHLALDMLDARSFLTEEKTTRSLAIAINEVCEYPKEQRFAFLVRIFIEVGRRLASKMTNLEVELIGLLGRLPDDLGNKPDTSMLIDAIDTALESRDDHGHSDTEKTIKDLIGSDEDKARVYHSSIQRSTQRFADTLAFVALNTTRSCIRTIEGEHKMKYMALILNQALRKGATQMTNDMRLLDKFALDQDGMSLLNEIIDNIVSVMERNLVNNDTKSGQADLSLVRHLRHSDLTKLNNHLDGPWSSFLFENLGSAERVIKLFASLVSRVPNDLKSIWINTYVGSAYQELRKTLSGFVTMQTYPHKSNNSELYLLNPKEVGRLLPSKVEDSIRDNYAIDKERLPGRCYLAGRRWRLFLARALRDYSKMSNVIKGFSDKISRYKVELLKEKGGIDLYRLCLPRLEVGLRGWSINGDPQSEDQAKTQFPIKNPLEKLTQTQDPFHDGFSLGYKIGFKVGYNEERNATLDIESGDSEHFEDNNKQSQSANMTQFQAKTRGDSILNSRYISRVTHRKASSASARRVFGIAIHEGYLTTLRVSLRSGIRIVAETGALIGSLRGKTYGGQEGREVGRVTADEIIQARSSIADEIQANLTKAGEESGFEAGRSMGQLIGSIVAQEAAVQAYLMSILGGGQLKHAKFHMEQYIMGGKRGFEFGIEEGKRIASSINLDPSAPISLDFKKPEPGKLDSDSSDTWQHLTPKLNSTIVDRAHLVSDHILVTGHLKGRYNYRKEFKNELARISLTNHSHQIEIDVHGFTYDDVTFLSMNGKVDNYGKLRGFMMASNMVDMKSFLS